MKPYLILLLLITTSLAAFSQNGPKFNKAQLLKNSSATSCKCIDSISVSDKAKGEIAKEIHRCIDDAVSAYQLMAKLSEIDSLSKIAILTNGKKEVNISLNLDKNSIEYRNYYYELERYLMANCKEIKDKIATNDKEGEESFSKNPEALSAYSKGLAQSKSKNYKEAINYFKQATAIDPRFAFAWDNMGLAYRMLDQYDQAIDAYKKSLEIDPEGLMPLQNIAIVYQYKKEYENAILAYQKLAEVDPNNPEVFYGIGNIYAMQLNDYEKGLDNICKAYNLYIEQKSPYRTDAEKVIQLIFAEMKKQGKEARFTEILKENNITAN